MKHLAIYDCETQETRLIDWRVIRNFIVSVLFIFTTIFCHFKNSEPFTLKNCIIVWVVVLIGWAINFILDNHRKMDAALSKFSNFLNSANAAMVKTGLIFEDELKECKDFYNSTFKERKNFKNEIGVILGSIATILGSATFIKFLDL